MGLKRHQQLASSFYKRDAEKKWWCFNMIMCICITDLWKLYRAACSMWRGKLYSFCIEGFSNTQRRKQNHKGFNVLTSLFFIAPPQISNNKYKDELERRPIQGHTRHDITQHIHIPTHCYSVVITALLHQDSILAGRTASIFELCLHLGFSYTPVQFRDFILQGCDIWLVFRLPGTWKSH